MTNQPMHGNQSFQSLQPFHIDTWRSLEERRGEVNRHQENAARLARSYATWTTTGWGEFRITKCFDFDCIFTEEPIFLSGVTMVDDDLINTRYPGVTAGVWRWRRDVNDYYTGAWVFFNVSTISYQMSGGQYPFTLDPKYKLYHHMSFEGIAIKDLPAYLLEL